MNKNDLINSLSEETMFSKKDIARVLEAMKRVLVRTLKKGGKVQWSGLGTFLVTRRPQRAGINPATKERIILAETMVPKFKAGKNLKEQVRAAVK
jgi:DNA-binding protein HU-beta